MSSSVIAMDRLPILAQACQRLVQGYLYRSQGLSGESATTSQTGRPAGAVEDEHRLLRRADDMDVGGSVIIWIDDHAQAIEPQNSRHSCILSKPNRLGKLRNSPIPADAA